MIHNPILPGFNPDPCICIKGDDIYLAVSSFEWFPGIPIYHSKDMKNWELYSHALIDAEGLELRGLPSAKGVWAPCLTYCKEDDLFYVVYGVMRSMNARYFDVDNYLISAKDPKGPWSEPVYLHSSGFDASLFHDDDGKKYIVALEWETRSDYEKPGPISIVEYDPIRKETVGLPKRIYRGATDRGCIEGPHLTKRNGYYYIMCAEGGTGYYHSVTMGRSENIFGPYERCPYGPIVTSCLGDTNERSDWDHLKPHYYNPISYLQKSGHGSYVDLPNGETWLVHLTSRPFVTDDENIRTRYRCSLGRETALQKMKWTEDGWLVKENGNPLADEWVKESELEEVRFDVQPSRDDFDKNELSLGWYAPRIDPKTFADLDSRPGWIRLRGQESGSSLNKASILAKKLRSTKVVAETKMDFRPESYQHTAGLILYYDNMNYLYLYKYFSETLDQCALSIIEMDNGNKIEHHLESRIPVIKNEDLYLRVTISDRKVQFYYSKSDEAFEKIGPIFDLSKLSDEYSNYGEFTGTFVGIACGDRLMHRHCADFDYFEYKEIED